MESTRFRCYQLSPLNLPLLRIRMHIDYESQARDSIPLLLNLVDHLVRRLLLCLFLLDLVGDLYPRCLVRRRRVKGHWPLYRSR